MTGNYYAFVRKASVLYIVNKVFSFLSFLIAGQRI